MNRTVVTVVAAALSCMLGACTSSVTERVSDAGSTAPRDTSADAYPADARAGDGAVGDAATTLEACGGKADGEACGPTNVSGICLNESCVTSSCGDGYIDSQADEQCEDGNEVDGDGCTRCRWDCQSSADCDDDNACNGAETCDTAARICLRGTLATDGSPCTLPGDAAGVCNGGVCVAAGCGDGVRQGDEECDDGNEVAGDGCEADCSWTCQQDADCDDRDRCTGTETCDESDPSAPVCVAGQAVVCEGTASCAGTCEPATGACIYPDGDGDGSSCREDCDDADPTVYPDARECEDDKDNDCDASTPDGADGQCLCYVDADGDTFPPQAAKVIVAVTCPAAYTPIAPLNVKTIDCRDSRADVYPGQQSWFAKPYCTALDALGACTADSWDYDCSGVVEQRYPFVYSRCMIKQGGACIGSGWADRAVPPCGAKAVYASCVLVDGQCMIGASSTVTQECR